MSKVLDYLGNVQRLISRIAESQAGNIEQAARLVADALENSKNVYAFGTGHSHMLAEELFYRAGGLVNIRPIFETSLMLHESASKSTKLERLSDYGEILFDEYGISEGDVLFLFSNSGRNGVSIDFALLAKERGVHTVVITNMEHTLSGASRHPSGKKLYELGEVVIDNCGCLGDACIDIPALGRKVSPTSTAVGAAILNSLTAQAVDYMIADGFEPEVFASSNVDGGDEINDRYLEKYKKEIRSL